MGFSLTGITSPIECKYTQTLGVHPDVAIVRCHPQGTAIPTTGTLTFTWPAQTSITLPNCEIDLARVTYSTNGHHVVIPVKDRRWRWARAAPISGYYNVRRASGYITSYKFNLQEICTFLLDQLGETTANVSALPTDIYPEVRWDCESPHLALEALLKEYGFDVALGFGTEAVRVWQLGVGSTLSATDEFFESQSFDPKIPPRWVRACFGASRAQVRFLLEPVGQEVDGTWELAPDLSYTPVGGWGSEDPELLPSVAVNEDADTYRVAIETVFRAYRVKAFADDTLDLPDGSGTLSDIQQVFPLESRLLDTENIRADGSYRPFRLFGKHIRKTPDTGQPPQVEVTDIDFEISGYPLHFDGESAIIICSKPLWYPNGTSHEFAELYLECTVGVRDATTNAPNRYEKDISFDVSGYGYQVLRIPELRAETIISYDDTHAPTATTTNQTFLDTAATAAATTLIAAYATDAGAVRVYAIPKLALRCDGAIQQVQHIMTVGEGSDAVNRTVASWNLEFDRGIPSRAQRTAHVKALLDSTNARWQTALIKRRELADD